MATIKPIEGRSVHQIQSGQVIVDLCSVVKELVENSLDAGATSIDVRFKNQGLDSIEVQDNGDGISPHNYETLALKHHTSKLSTYSDLTTLQTFGFRGEALSSLCALSHFSVVTCMAQDAPKGTKLDFEVSGKLKRTSVVAAQKGTTVSVENLFNNLPVRRQELQRNIKREWNRVVGALGQYACIQTGVKFSVSQQAGKGKKTTLFSTKGNHTTRENIVNVFGAKTLTALITLDLNLELEPTSAPSQRWSTQEDDGKKDIRVVGHISRPATGEGRQTPDRQMFFVNARPCGLPQVSKAFNEVYKAYNGSQSPFIFANIELDTHMYDVNVSPDKRTILLHDQNRMLENLKTALTELFESQDYTVPISQLPAQKQPTYRQLTISRENTATSRTSQTPARSTEPEESDDGSVPSRREESIDSEVPARPDNVKLRKGASRESMNRDSGAVNLISKWAGRKAEDRVDSGEDEVLQPAKAAPKLDAAGLSDEKRRLVEKLRRESEVKQLAKDISEEPESSGIDTQSTILSASTQSQRPNIISNGPVTIGETADSPGEEAPSLAEEPIPSLQSPSKLKPTPSIADRFSITPRTQRTQAEIATITIGDHVVTSSIGTPCPKRSKFDSPQNRNSSARRTQAPARPVPSFGNSLSQRFSAPGTAPQVMSDESEPEDDIEDRPPTPLFVEDPPGESPEQDDTVDRAREETNKQRTDSLVEGDDVDSADTPPQATEDGDYVDESEKAALEQAKVQEMIEEAEKAAVVPSQENIMRTKQLLKGGSKKKDTTFNLVKNINTTTSKIGEQFRALQQLISSHETSLAQKAEDEALDSEKAEEKLSLTITKDDFAKMRIIGQFNLGFILASRASESKDENGISNADDMFIIDQHASDEKYNFERLQATTIVQSQTLVCPKTLDLTALEEEIVLENLPALESNGFIISVDESGASAVGNRCQLLSLPISRETAFSLSDLDELISLLAEKPPGTIPRPSKVRKMFAMRACRSSIMIGKTLSGKQMEKVVRHLGELDKPWNCPHGRPTMRHLCGLGVWDELGWKGDGVETKWAAYVRGSREEEEDGGEDEDMEDGADENTDLGEDGDDIVDEDSQEILEQEE